MAYSNLRVGDRVIPADPSHMLTLCGTYNSAVTHGEIISIDPEYVESINVIWHYSDGHQGTVAYSFQPFDLMLLRDDHVIDISSDGGHGYPYRARCVCGWQSNTYAASHAAETMGFAHVHGIN